jgi:hypothetical protein
MSVVSNTLDECVQHTYQRGPRGCTAPPRTLEAAQGSHARAPPRALTGAAPAPAPPAPLPLVLSGHAASLAPY